MYVCSQTYIHTCLAISYFRYVCASKTLSLWGFLHFKGNITLADLSPNPSPCEGFLHFWPYQEAVTSGCMYVCFQNHSYVCMYVCSQTYIHTCLAISYFPYVRFETPLPVRVFAFQRQHNSRWSEPKPLSLWGFLAFLTLPRSRHERMYVCMFPKPLCLWGVLKSNIHTYMLSSQHEAQS